MPIPERVSSESRTVRTVLPRTVRERTPFLRARRTAPATVQETAPVTSSVVTKMPGHFSPVHEQKAIAATPAGEIDRPNDHNLSSAAGEGEQTAPSASIETRRFALAHEYYRLVFPKKAHLRPREYPEAAKRFFSHILRPENPAFSKKYSAWYWGYVGIRTGLLLVPLLPFAPAAVGIGWQVLLPLFLSTFLAPGAFMLLKTYMLASREMYIKPLAGKVRNVRAVGKEYRNIKKDEKYKDVPRAKKKDLAREVVYAREFSADFKDELEKQQQNLKNTIPSVSDEVAQALAFKNVLTYVLYRSLSTMTPTEREQLKQKFPDASQQFHVYHYLRRQAQKAQENMIADSIIMQGSSLIKTALVGRALTAATSFQLLTFLLFSTGNISIAAAGTSVAFSAVWRLWSRSLAAFHQGKNEVLEKRNQ